MQHQIVSRRLSRPQVEILLDHVDGTAFVPSGVSTDERSGTRHALVRLRLIRYVGGPNTRKPTHTEITEDGRMVLCHALGDYAEALIRAGHGVNGRSVVSEIAAKIAGRLESAI